MKELFIAAVVLLCFSTADFAQTLPVNKSDASIMMVVKKVSDKKAQRMVEPLGKHTERVTFAFAMTIVFCIGVVVALSVVRQIKNRSSVQQLSV